MLHTVNKSPFERNALDACLARAVKGSAILLYEDAVYAATKGASTAQRVGQAAKDHKVYVLGPDLLARGFNEGQVLDGITVVDYDGFVDLVAELGTVNAWL
ncbi:MAG: sulfurtransferase complex subunit TusB [Alphaproteobacteria bacterium]|nr:sulfurtransferase complex subunit TusB [Alphaproteobacteria bacterium]MBF0128890.1 sulfurtransferase complex subunit TusB [Alphaproteobacteria bacterium]